MEMTSPLRPSVGVWQLSTQGYCSVVQVLVVVVGQIPLGDVVGRRRQPPDGAESVDELRPLVDEQLQDFRAAVERALADHPRITAVFLETIQGEGGVNPSRVEFLQGLRAICDQHDKLLMLDEPSKGLSPVMADFIFERLIEIRRQTQLTVLLVEQRVAEALESADHGYVLEAGRVVLEGSHEVLSSNDRVRQAYLGM